MALCAARQLTALQRESLDRDVVEIVGEAIRILNSIAASTGLLQEAALQPAILPSWIASSTSTGMNCSALSKKRRGRNCHE